MILLTYDGLQAFYPSHPSRFMGYLELFELAAPYIDDNYDLNISFLRDVVRKIRGILSDLMVLYYTFRMTRLHEKNQEHADVFDNIRLAVYIAYRLYSAVTRICSMEGVLHDLPLLPHESREAHWLYDHYVAWRDLMAESFGGNAEAVQAMTNAHIDETDFAVMSHSRIHLDRVMGIAQIHGMPISHMVRPVNFTTAVYPQVRRMVALELRMRMNNLGQLGHTEIAPWHHDSLFVTPPSAANFVLARRVGDHV